jgi:hypothetical protein
MSCAERHEVAQRRARTARACIPHSVSRCQRRRFCGSKKMEQPVGVGCGAFRAYAELKRRSPKGRIRPLRVLCTHARRSATRPRLCRMPIPQHPVGRTPCLTQNSFETSILLPTPRNACSSITRVMSHPAVVRPCPVPYAGTALVSVISRQLMDVTFRARRDSGCARRWARPHQTEACSSEFPGGDDVVSAKKRHLKPA